MCTKKAMIKHSKNQNRCLEKRRVLRSVADLLSKRLLLALNSQFLLLNLRQLVLDELLIGQNPTTYLLGSQLLLLLMMMMNMQMSLLLRHWITFHW